MRLLMVGAGATGGYIGARLVQAGRDLTFLVRGHRAEQLRAHGLQVRSPLGDFSVQPKVITADQLNATPPFDLILISVKAYQLAQAMEDFAPAVSPQTVLLPMLNGMHQLEVLQQRFGRGQVLGGSVRVVADLDAAGRIHQASALHELSYGELSYGEPEGERTARIGEIDAVLRGAGFDAVLQPNILATLWQKWWILASLGAVCVLGRGTVGEVAAVPHGEALVQAVIDECIAIAERNGYPPDAKMLDSHRKRLVEPGSTLTSSMYRDMTKNAPVEADHILGDLLQRARGVPAPLLTGAYVQLKVYERGRQD